jgi:hypothetical protein
LPSTTVTVVFLVPSVLTRCCTKAVLQSSTSPFLCPAMNATSIGRISSGADSIFSQSAAAHSGVIHCSLSSGCQVGSCITEALRRSVTRQLRIASLLVVGKCTHIAISVLHREMRVDSDHARVCCMSISVLLSSSASSANSFASGANCPCVIFALFSNMCALIFFVAGIVCSIVSENFSQFVGSGPGSDAAHSSNLVGGRFLCLVGRSSNDVAASQGDAIVFNGEQGDGAKLPSAFFPESCGDLAAASQEVS